MRIRINTDFTWQNILRMGTIIAVVFILLTFLFTDPKNWLPFASHFPEWVTDRAPIFYVYQIIILIGISSFLALILMFIVRIARR